MGFVMNFIKGLIIGVGAIAPGVSGGSLAVLLGVYEKITGLIANVIDSLKHNFKFFLAVGAGGCVGILLFSRLIEYLFLYYEAPVKYLFIGLIAGTFPSVFRHANKNGFRKIYIPIFIISLAITLAIAFAERSTVYVYEGQTSFPWLLLYGAVLGFGTIIPGISASFILMYLGSYETVLGSIADMNFALLVPLGIGFVLSIILLARLVRYLLKIAFGYTYYVILGFVIGSIFSIFPGFELKPSFLICPVLLIAGFLVSLWLGEIEKKKNKGAD